MHWKTAAHFRAALLEVWEIVVLGSGPNRIGQGIEFDYCCCHIACITTVSGAAAAVNAIRALQRENLTVRSLQEYHGRIRETAVRCR